jgi:glucose/mannose-6-phosphate isomerase
MSTPADIPDGTRQMFRLVADLPRQLEGSAELPGLDAAGTLPKGCRRIILCGMGGSAIAGDLIAPLIAPSGIQLTVWRDYGLPAWAGPGDLVLCSSYSGGTEETLSGALRAAEMGLERFVVSTGGRLGEIAAADGLGMVTLPPGLPPRASLGFGLGVLVRLLGAWGLIEDADREIATAVAGLDRAIAARFLAEDPDAEPLADPAGHVPVSRLAEDLAGRLPIIHTAGTEAHAAGVRLRAQINENSKLPAALARYPELDHNELEGWDLASGDRDRVALVILHAPDGDERLDRRVRVTRDLLADQFGAVHTITAAGERTLSRILDLVQYGDFLSCHLAAARGADALPVDRIAALKKALADPRGSA